jgi:uncharacterized protein (DUF1800 family)
MRASLVLLSLTVQLPFLAALSSIASEPLTVSRFTRTNSQVRLEWAPYPAAKSYRIERSETALGPFIADSAGELSSSSWNGSSELDSEFFRIGVEPLSEDALLTANVLNRLAYGPTPDELDRILTGPSPIGPQAYIEEQLAPEGLIEDMDQLPAKTGWIYVTETGPVTAARLYLYLSGPGSVLLDDVKLVRGTQAEVGTSFVQNGSFESPLAPRWVATANFAQSTLVTNAGHSGNQCLLLVATAAGSGSENALYQSLTGLQVNQTYTLSYWYYTTNQDVTLTLRCSGGTSVNSTRPIRPVRPLASEAYSLLTSGQADVSILRSWFVLHAVESKRQLLEVLTQFFENHFVTEHSKSSEYLDRYYDGGAWRDREATRLEFREISRWRNALLKPDCTFRELLQISAESPAQIIYLDTVNSRGDGNNIANENYSRELLELYTFGVDNGYDQKDIVATSRAWTGWSIRLVDPQNVGDPFAPQTTNKLDSTLTNAVALGSISNLVGVWSFGFRTNRHNLKEKVIFPGKVVPERFGPPWAGRNYQLRLPARAGNDGVKDGYDVVNHLADQPFTAEFISVKLCRLFIHDGFVHGEYDYRDPDLSAEGKLVHECMLAWENGNPKGQIRSVLRTIFNSELFRKNGGSMQKVKTPLEFCVSAIRALRADLGNGTFSASTDGFSISGRSASASTSPLTRMGVMRLFSRVEPDGYPEAGAGWISGGTLAERAHFIQSFLMGPGDAQKSDGISGGNRNLSDPVSLLKAKLPAASWSDPGQVAQFFLDRLFPGEGAGNLLDYQASMIRFLNQSDDGLTASPFNLLGVDTLAYDTRVRSMVSLLMISPRFEEQ